MREGLIAAGAAGALLFSLSLLLGQDASAQGIAAAAEQPRPAPRWPDGRPRLGSEPGAPGMWTGFESRPMLFEFDVIPEGSIIAHDDPARLPSGRFPKPNYTDIPFQPWAKQLFEYRSRHRLEPYTRCKASPAARFIATAYGTQFVELPDLERIYIFPTGGPRTYRVVHMDGREHPQDLTPSYLGHSVGHWEGDTLVVETVGFNEKAWIDAEGSPHTEQLRTVERFTRVDYDTLRYEILVDDPGAYTEPWESGFHMDWTSGETFEFICQEFNLAPELMLGTLYDEVDRAVPIVPSAQHSAVAKFDPARPVTLEGRVTHVNWTDPRVHVFLEVREGGRLRDWYVELESRAALERSGWREDSLQAGETIRLQGWLARDGSRQARADSVEHADSGQVLLAASNPPASYPEPSGRDTPRWDDGQPRLGPPPGESGYWIPTATVMVEDGVEVAIDPDGLLHDLADVDRVAPLQQWARDLYAYRQRNLLRSDPMYLQCKPPGGPRKFQVRYGIKLIEDRDLERIFVAAGGGNRDWHIIYTDGRPFVGGFGDDDGNLLYYGRNRAAWEGDTLVIESEGFNEAFWFANGGLPHTEHLRLTERLTRTDFDTLHYEVTIDDPGAFTRPWTSSWTLVWVPGEDPPEYYCQDNRP